MDSPAKMKRPATMREQSMVVGIPRSDDGEKAMVSCFLARPKELIPNFLEVGKLEWFHHTPTRELVAVMFSLFEEKGDLEFVMLGKRLQGLGVLEKLAGVNGHVLAELLNFTPTPAHYPYYMEILSECYTRREAMRRADTIRDKAGDEGIKLKETGEAITEELSAITSLFAERDKEETLMEQIEAWHGDFDERAKGNKVSAMPTRWATLNLRMGGLNVGYTLISGEYSAGKSVLLRNFMVDACLTKGRPGLLVNYETSVKQTISGLVCDIAGIRSDVVFRPDQNTPSPSEQKSIKWALKKIAASKLRIVHQVHLSAEGICHRARKIKANEGDVVVGVDYLQKIPRPTHIEKNANQERELAVNSDTLQKGAADTGCPFIVALQLNEGGTARGSKSINMDGDTHYRIEGSKGIYVEKFKEGARNHHLPIFLNLPKLRFEEKEQPETFPN